MWFGVVWMWFGVVWGCFGVVWGVSTDRSVTDVSSMMAMLYLFSLHVSYKHTLKICRSDGKVCTIQQVKKETFILIPWSAM